MADKMYINCIQCSGRVLYLRYDERVRDLSILMLVSSRKRNTKEGNDWFHDTPMFHMYGDAAAEWKEKLKKDDHITVVGHIHGIKQEMRRQNSGLYKPVWLPEIIADTIQPDTPRYDVNTVTIAGDISRVYRNADPGKKFYIPTVRIPAQDDSGHVSLVNFIYFDRNMEWEPHTGDFVYVNGSVRTKRERQNENDRRNIVLTSIVANNATLTK